MDFDGWRSDLLRQRLFDYAERKGPGGTRLTIQALATRLMTSDAAPGMYALFSGDEKGEYLRRFLFKNGSLSKDRYPGVMRFLIKAGFLQLEEMDESPPDDGAMAVLHRYLATTTEDAQALLRHIAGAFEANLPFGYERFRLSFVLAENGTYLRVEETFERPWRVLDAPYAIRYRKDIGRPFTREILRGCAFASTDLNLLHVFLQNPGTGERITYVQTDLASDGDKPTRLYLMRAGFAAKVGAHPESDGPFTVSNVFRFLPVASAVAPRERSR